MVERLVRSIHMYTVNKTRSRKKLLAQFVLAFVIFIVLAAILFWFFVIKNTDESSANFVRSGGTIAVVAPATIDISTDEFTVTLPEGWALLGKMNPYYNQVYYEFQSQVKDYENRWLRVYVDIYPEDFALNRLLPVAAKDNGLVPGTISSDCKTFQGAPKPGTGQVTSQTWTAVWEGVTFTCNMVSPVNNIGTGSVKDGYGVPVTGTKGTHEYFFVYIDHNVRPDASILTDAVKSFEAL